MKKVAIVTGCAKGIGKSIALELAHNGYDIIGTYNTSLNQIQNLKVEIDRIGVNFDYYKLDVSSEIEIDNFYNEIKKKYGKIDILVNNAALSLDSEFSSKSKDEFMKVLEVNLVGPFLLIQRFSKIMDSGIIVNISSTDGINTYSKLNMDYSASKAGLINLTKSLALELKNIEIELKDLDFTLVCDKNWTKEALTNIIKNAIEHLDSNDGRITIKGEDNPLYESITITDNGPGIKKEDIKNIFKRFYSTNTTKNSVGIGLNMAKLIIEKQNGKIEVESELGRYTTFRIIFPKKNY